MLNRFFIFLVICVLMAGCSQSSKQLNIALLMDEAVSYNEDQVAGARMLVQSVNQHGGLKVGNTRYKVRLLIRDCGPFGAQSLKVARELLINENVSIFIGPNSTRALLKVKPMLDSDDLILFTNGSTLPDITKGTTKLFRTTYSDKDSVDLIFRFVTSKAKIKKIAALYDKVNPFTRNLVDMLDRKLQERSQIHFEKLGYLSGETDFKNLVAAIKRSRAELIFLPGFTHDLKLQIKQIREMGINLPIIASDALDLDDVKHDPLFFGVHAVQLIHGSSLLKSKRGQRLYEDYLARFQRAPSVGTLVSLDTLGIIFDVISKTNSVAPKRLVQELNSGYLYDGYIGRAMFEHGESQLKPRLYLIGEAGVSEETF